MKFKKENINFSIEGSYTFLENDFQKSYVFKRLWENIERPKIVCLCGSTKFKNQFEHINKQLTREGCIVLTVGWFGHLDNEPMSVEQKNALDVLHLRKIDLCDQVMVVNFNGYIGESTKKEIEYALKNGKEVEYFWELIND